MSFAQAKAQLAGTSKASPIRSLRLRSHARGKRNNLVAVRNGLPAVGSSLLNVHGIEWVVESHVYLPTDHTIQTWGEGKGNPESLYPSLVPQNLSERLTEFIAAVDRCTTKNFVFIDTLPGFKGRTSIPWGNSINTGSMAGANIVSLDAARVHETVIAHEIGHAWVQYVDEAEDMRVMEDVSDPQRLQQLTFVQSFVLDMKVNDLLRRKGFDMIPIERDHAEAITNLGCAIEAGYRASTKREQVFWALQIAAKTLDEERGIGVGLVPLDKALARLCGMDGSIGRLSERLADAVRRNGYQGRDEILRSIDECLLLSFEHSGDEIDLDRDLLLHQPPEPDFDKWPGWIEGAPVALKTAAGKVMARADVPSSAHWSLSDEGGRARLHFILQDGTQVGDWLLDHAFPFGDPHASLNMHLQNQRRSQEHLERQSAEINRINQVNRVRQEEMFRDMGKPTPQVPPAPHTAGQAEIKTSALPVLPGRPDALGMPAGRATHALPSSARVHRGPTPLGGLSGALALLSGSRTYMAGYGRFLSQAALEMQLGGEHPYVYCENNPGIYVDPSGMKCTKSDPICSGISVATICGAAGEQVLQQLLGNIIDANKSSCQCGLTFKGRLSVSINSGCFESSGSGGFLSERCRLPKMSGTCSSLSASDSRKCSEICPKCPDCKSNPPINYRATKSLPSTLTGRKLIISVTLSELKGHYTLDGTMTISYCRN